LSQKRSRLVLSRAESICAGDIGILH
jgi:hypothetical protein